VDGTRRLEEIVIPLPSGVRFVPGAGGPSATPDLNDFQRAALRKEMQALEDDSDFVVLDTGAGIGSAVIHFAAGADAALVVTTPEPSAIAGAYAVIKVLCLRSYSGHIRLLVNCAADRREAHLTHRTVEEAARRFLDAEVASAGFVLEDPKVREAVRSRRPFALAFPLCPATTCLAATAAQFCREALEAAGQHRRLQEAADGSA
jgi:flagellar biosynthesis protein FlhG